MRHPDPLNAHTATTSSLPDDLTFFHRPPPSAPSALSLTTNPASPLLRPTSSAQDATLPPPLKEPQPGKPRLSDENIAEMQRLRALNPSYYTRKRLAEQFDCSPAFVGLVARLSTSDHRTVQRKLEKAHADVRAQWGEKKLITREIRRRRKQFW